VGEGPTEDDWWPGKEGRIWVGEGHIKIEVYQGDERDNDERRKPRKGQILRNCFSSAMDDKKNHVGIKKRKKMNEGVTFFINLRPTKTKPAERARTAHANIMRAIKYPRCIVMGCVAPSPLPLRHPLLGA
jgi:hypothetical protein